MLPLFYSHSGLRYLVLAAGVLDVIVFGALLVRGKDGGRAARILMAVFTGLLDLQILLGIALVIAGIFYPALFGHILMMVLAAGVAHFASVAARRAEGLRATRIRLTGGAIALGLLAAGILAIGRAVIGSSPPSISS
jgi:hypothetical protein